MTPVPIRVGWNYELDLRGPTLLLLLSSSIERRVGVRLTAIGPRGRDVDLTSKLIEQRFAGPLGGIKLKGRSGAKTLVKASVDCNSEAYDIPGLNWSAANADFRSEMPKANDLRVNCDLIKGVFADLCEPQAIKSARAQYQALFGHARYEELQDAWKGMYLAEDFGHGVGWLTYYSNTYLDARGQGEALLTKAGLTIFKRLRHGVLTQTDEAPLADTDAYIDRLITIARALRVPNRRPDPPPKPQPPVGPGYYVAVKKRAKKSK